MATDALRQSLTTIPMTGAVMEALQGVKGGQENNSLTSGITGNTLNVSDNNAGATDIDIKTAISQCNSTIQQFATVDASSLAEKARNGERHKGVYNDAINKSQSALEKSIVSHTAQVETHARKIQNPAEYDVGWQDKDARQREGLLRKWQKDLQRNAEQAAVEIEAWKERFGNEQ